VGNTILRHRPHGRVTPTSEASRPQRRLAGDSGHHGSPGRRPPGPSGRDITTVAVIVIATTGMLLAFLSLMPAKMHPLIFTLMQDRYLTAVLPFAAIAAGIGVATVLSFLKGVGERRAFVITLALIGGLNLVVSNSSWDSYQTGEFSGIRQSLVAARSRGIAELVLPYTYERSAPDRYHRYGARLTFMSFAEAENVRDYLRSDRTRAVFVPRHGFEEWRPHGYRGESGQLGRLEGQLVGWFYRAT